MFPGWSLIVCINYFWAISCAVLVIFFHLSRYDAGVCELTWIFSLFSLSTPGWGLAAFGLNTYRMDGGACKNRGVHPVCQPGDWKSLATGDGCLYICEADLAECLICLCTNYRDDPRDESHVATTSDPLVPDPIIQPASGVCQTLGTTSRVRLDWAGCPGPKTS
ncbi:uncharacterized protein BO80DRAFT_270056 [Aspergillus ibericus CBS 121593]|uniref:Uncharacterized protein n=1 Tax=Aspergillus ibericus CBS 121593 TaxID=1448316 RepID=A0A395H777_9EURO|nr:hypothetical protein BO80DRAFT_270056 [Aspergillus ibericus CBS 121593]RAL03772.1 hypothetical protein BO80DRAFT_270056 [Aspergillus ibericus CBS 121593]